MKIHKSHKEQQNAENRMQKEQKLDEQHQKQYVMSQFLSVRAQRAHCDSRLDSFSWLRAERAGTRHSLL